MEWYLLKSALILSILFGFYKLFLENESMHVFKRFYLLASLPVSFLIPLITFKTYVEMPVSTQTVFITQSVPVESVVAQVNILPFVLWGIYGIGVVYFAIKFGRNLKNLLSKIKDNPKFKQDNITHVLLKKPVIPHTFFNYVFLNKQKFEAREIPDEVIAHEYVHANQKHSIDILTIELLQIAFWFNPLLYFVKRSIKLNHEFLADRAVLNLGTDRAVYQNLLLAFSSSAVTPVLANSINYSFIKKRFTVMKKQTSTRAIWLRSLLVLPLLAFLLYGFSDKKEVIKTSDDLQKSTSSYTARSISIKILEDGTYTINGIPANKNTLKAEVNKLHQDITPEIRNNIMNIHVTSSFEISNEEVWFLYNSLLDYGFYRLVTPEQEVVKGKGNTPFAIEQTKQQQNNNNSWSITPSESGFTIENQNATQQQKATPAEVEEYNKLARKYNNMSRDKLHIITAEIDRMKFIYGKMTAQQKENVEPFPYELPIPPPSPPATDGSKMNVVPPAPPVPVMPVSVHDPLKLAEEVRENGGEFYFEDKKMGYDEFVEKMEQIKAARKNYCFALERGENDLQRLRITVQE